MSEGIKLAMNDDGSWGIYDDTYDITIHCESEEEQERARKLLSDANKMQWIPCSERLPKDGEMVLLSCENPCVLPGIGIYSGVTFYPTTTELTGNRSYESVGIHINAWMPLPEPYKGE